MLVVCIPPCSYPSSQFLEGLRSTRSFWMGSRFESVAHFSLIPSSSVHLRRMSPFPRSDSLPPQHLTLCSPYPVSFSFSLSCTLRCLFN